MATKARQQYFADESSLQKDSREFSIADDIQQKIASVETGAEVNTIETVKVNGVALAPDANKAVNISVPDVIDNLYTVDADDALSAKQGKLLYDYIQNLQTIGRFLSNWNSATGLPVTNPSESPYTYKAGDYYRVSNVAASPATNYKPNGSSFVIGQASTTVETNNVNISDLYLYDGTDWILLSNSGSSIAVDSSLSTTSTNPVENRVITNALNGKQDALTAGTGINITSNTISTKWVEVTVTTAYTTVAKVGTTTAGNYTPTKGDFLLVNFVNGCSVGNPTLNIDNSGAVNIKLGNTNATADTFNLGSGANSNVKVLMYCDGDYYKIWSVANTTYSAMSVSEGQTGTATGQRTMRADYLKQIIKYHAVSDTAYGSGWDGQTDIAPSQNAVYDKIESINEVPSGGTTDQVLTKTANGYGWANATGGSTIEYVTQAEYTALLPGAESDGKHYFIYTPSVVPPSPGRQPGVNTVAYYPLTSVSTINDQSGNNYNLTNSGLTFGTNQGVDCASMTSSVYAYSTDIPLPDGNDARTFSFWFYNTIKTNDTYYMGYGTYTDNKFFSPRIDQWMDAGKYGMMLYGNADFVTSYASTTGVWELHTMTYDGTTVLYYINGVQVGTKTAALDTTAVGSTWKFVIGCRLESNGAPGSYVTGYMSNVIIEDKAWTNQEVSDYFNQTKANYGIS